MQQSLLHQPSKRCAVLFHRTHLGGYGIPAIPTPPAMIVFSHRWHRCIQMFRLRSIVSRNTQNTQKFSSARKFCEFCGSTFQQEASVCSVNSVGGCNGCSVGAAETAAPPGWVRVAALNNPPTDGTDAHRCLGCVVLSHGWHRSTQMVRVRVIPQNAQKSLAVGGCSGSLVGAVLAWLVHLRQVHPLRGCVGMAGMPYPPTIAQTGRVS